MNIKISMIIDYISFFVRKYTEIQCDQMKNTFRFVNINKNSKDTKIIFQVVGKSTFLECTPAEILSNDAFIEKFSKKDIQKISYAHAQNEHQLVPDIKLISQEFDTTHDQIYFTLRDRHGNTSLKTAAEVMLDKTIIKKLSPQEALNIGYIAGYEHSQNNLIIKKK